MGQTLLDVGLACIIAAIVGGGLDAFGVKIPLLDSTSRKVGLGAFGVLLLLASAYPSLSKLAQINGKIFDIPSNQNISGVNLTLVDSNGKVVVPDVFTTGQDGSFQFALPRGIDKKQLPLGFQLSRIDWAAHYVPDQKVTDLSSDREINLPVDSASLIVVKVSPAAAAVPAMPASVAGGPAPVTMFHAYHFAMPLHALAAVPAAPAAPAIIEKTVFATGTVQLLVRELPDALEFEFHVRPTDVPTLNFDVNKNNAVDANVDVSYGLTGNGSACTQYRLTAGSWTACGGFHSASTVAISQGINAGAPVKIILWHIPKSEINAANGDAHLTVGVYNGVTKGTSYFPSQDFSQTFRTN